MNSKIYQVAGPFKGLSVMRGEGGNILNKAKAWGIIKTELPKIKLFKVDNTRVRYREELESQKLGG